MPSQRLRDAFFGPLLLGTLLGILLSFLLPLAGATRLREPFAWLLWIPAAVILLLAGIFAWATVGTLETKADARVIVENHSALVSLNSAQEVASGMPLRISSEEFRISDIVTDAYGRVVGVAEVSLPDGIYEGTVVTDTVHPIEFLLNSRG